MENQEENNNLQEPNQEIDYKVEYEKMTEEKEREETITFFKESMDEQGYEFDEESFFTNCNKYDNQELKNFEEMFKTLQPRSKCGFKIKIGADEQQEQQYVERKATFKDYIESKKK